MMWRHWLTSLLPHKRRYLDSAFPINLDAVISLQPLLLLHLHPYLHGYVLLVLLSEVDFGQLPP